MRIKIILTAVLFIAFSVASSTAQNQVDPAFNAVPSQSLFADKGQVLQPDGKVIIWGGPLTGSSSAKGQIARLNSDGTLDNTFNYCACHLKTVSNIVVQPDGKLLVSGADSISKSKLIRLHADASLDDSFSPVIAMDGVSYFGRAYVWAVAPDGKVYVENLQQPLQFPQLFHRTLHRYNSDGNVDTGFTTLTLHNGTGNPTGISDMVIMADGKFFLSIVGGTGGSFGSVDRYNQNGTEDNGWEFPTLSADLGNNTWIGGLALQNDGSLIVSGRFDAVNGVNKKNVVRLAPAGNVDLAFTAPTAFFRTAQVKVLSSGKILVSAMVDVDATYKLRRLNADGSLDSFLTKGGLTKGVRGGGEFAPPGDIKNVLNKWVLDASERVVFFAESNTAERKFYRLNSDGSQDNSFNPSVGETGKVFALARQADGKVIVAGNFIQMNGTARNLIARVNTDGTLDPTFDPGTGFNTSPKTLLIQSDGKILAIGDFASYNGTARPFAARINSDGTLDTSFIPTFDTAPKTIALQTDGKILAGGSFTLVNSTARTGMARLNSDGSLDAFNPIIGGSATINAIVPQADGKIMTGGAFNGVNGFSRSNLVRLNADGSLDNTYNATSMPALGVMTQQTDGKIVFASSFSVLRRNTDGTADASLNVEFGGPDIRLNALFIQPDGSILIGGNFTNIFATFRANFVRVSSTGKVDFSLFPNGANGEVRAMTGQPDGKVIVVGDFSIFNTAIRAGIARISTLAFRNIGFCDFDGDGRSDVSVYRPGVSEWYLLQSTNGFFGLTFGTGGDVPVPADFDGDGKTDMAIFRPVTGTWWYRSSINSAFYAVAYGLDGDIPLPSDIDGDNKADFVLYRPSNNYWYRYGSTVQAASVHFGQAGDIPVIGDFDGDGKGDPAIFRPSNGYWWYWSSATGVQTPFQWGKNGDIPVPADYDDDGKTDMAIFRPSNGTWFIQGSGGGLMGGTFGLNGDRPVAADYDGDGKADMGVFRPSNGIWYVQQTTAGFMGLQFGTGTDKPLPNAFLP